MIGRYIKEFKRNDIINSITGRATGWNIKLISKDHVFKLIDEIDLIRLIMSSFAEDDVIKPFESMDLNMVFTERVIPNARQKLIAFFELGGLFAFPIKVLMTNYWIVINHDDYNESIIFFERIRNDTWYYPDLISKDNTGNFNIKFWNKKLIDNSGKSYSCCYNLELMIVPNINSSLTEDSIHLSNRLLAFEDRIISLEREILDLKSDGWTTIVTNDL